MIVELTHKDALFKQCREIRRKVFVEEQGVSQALEWENDEVSVHFLYLVEDKTVGAARVRFLGKTAKIERLAILKEFRGKGIGRELLEKAVEFCRKKHAKHIMMHAQFYLKDYYSKLGFIPVGKPFVEAGIKHVEMELK